MRGSEAGPFCPSTSAFAGILLILIASVLWSLNGALIKFVTDEGRGPGGAAIAFYRSLIAGLFLLPLSWGKWRTAGQRQSRVLTRPAALWCVVFFTLMTLTFVVANTMTQAANVIILQYTSTFWIFGLSPLVLKERPRTSDLWILGLAMAGIGIIFAGNASASPLGLTIALASGLFYALLTLMIRRLRDANSAAVTVLNNLGSAALLFPLVLLLGQVSLSGRSLALLAFMGVVQFGVPYYLYTLGLARVPAYQAAIITLLEPVLVPLWAYLVIGRSEIPPAWTIVGGGVIMIALLLFLNAARRAAATTSREAGASPVQAPPLAPQSTATIAEDVHK